MEKLLHRCVTTGCWKPIFYNGGAAISEAAGVLAEYYRIPATSNICYELFDFGVDECVLCHCNTYSEIHFPEGIYRGWTSVPEYHDRVYSDRVRIPCFALEAD